MPPIPSIDRRTVLKAGVAAGAGLLVGPRSVARAATPAPVFVANHADMYSINTTTKEQTIGHGVDSCALELASHIAGSTLTNVGQAWEAILGSVNASTKIAIHVTCFYADTNNFNSPQIDTIKGIVRGLCRMLGSTFPAGNIRVFDNNMGSEHRPHVVYGAQAFNDMGVVHADNAFDGGAPMTVNGYTLYPHIYMSDADHVINLARLSGHQYGEGSGPGITGCVKGLMGAVSTSTSLLQGLSAAFHDNNKIWQGHQDYWAIMRPRTRVSILDMVKASYDERHAFVQDVGEICMGTDPCAVDGYAAWMLQQLKAIDSRFVHHSLTIPNAVAASMGDWTTDYVKNDCPVPPNSGPTPATRNELDAALKNRRNSATDDAAVRAAIKSYREQ